MKNNKARYLSMLHLYDDYWDMEHCLSRVYLIPEKLQDIMVDRINRRADVGRRKHFTMFSHEALAVIAYIKSGAKDDVLTQYILDNMHLYIEFFTGNGMTEETALLLQWKKENGNFESVDDIDRKFEI